MWGVCFRTFHSLFRSPLRKFYLGSQALPAAGEKKREMEKKRWREKKPFPAREYRGSLAELYGIVFSSQPAKEKEEEEEEVKLSAWGRNESRPPSCSSSSGLSRCCFHHETERKRERKGHRLSPLLLPPLPPSPPPPPGPHLSSLSSLQFSAPPISGHSVVHCVARKQEEMTSEAVSGPEAHTKKNPRP